MLDVSLTPFSESAVLTEPKVVQPLKAKTLVRTNRWDKRLFDVLVSGIVIVFLLSWFVPVVCLAIRLTSPGPALFVQLRTGRNGRPFRCLKFRTMTYDKNAQFRQATRNDCRVTPIGRVLRKTNIDELPQVFNVLLGQMSLVGPRPHPIPLDAKHWHTLPGYAARYVVKPGITGLAQVRGCRGETAKLIDMRHRVRYDHLYIRRQSLALDVKICLWTALKMVKGDEKAC